MLKIDDKILCESISQVLERMAFMMLLPPEEEMPSPEQSVEVTIEFRGQVSGQVHLLAGTDLIEMIAANFIGVEPFDPEASEKRVDGFKEILNTVCGTLLPRLADSPADVFDISIPEAREYNRPYQWDALVQDNDATVMECEYNPFAFWITEI